MMTNTQLYLAMGVPSVLVLLGVLLNQIGQARLETRLTVIEGDLRQFYKSLGDVGGKVEILLSDRKSAR
jgi:hypothetical protein